MNGNEIPLENLADERTGGIHLASNGVRDIMSHLAPREKRAEIVSLYGIFPVALSSGRKPLSDPILSLRWHTVRVHFLT